MVHIDFLVLHLKLSVFFCPIFKKRAPSESSLVINWYLFFRNVFVLQRPCWFRASILVPKNLLSMSGSKLSFESKTKVSFLYQFLYQFLPIESDGVTKTINLKLLLENCYQVLFLKSLVNQSKLPC